MMAVTPNDQERRVWVLSALEEYECRLTRYAVRLVGDEDVARDAVQHAFLKMCDAERQGAGNLLWLGWLN